MYTDLENQDILIIRTLLVGPKVPLIHRFHCSHCTKSRGRGTTRFDTYFCSTWLFAVVIGKNVVVMEQLDL